MVMQTLAVVPKRERVIGETEPNRWWRKKWISARGYDPAHPPQVSFDRVADREPTSFRCGRSARANSVLLVNTLAKRACLASSCKEC